MERNQNQDPDPVATLSDNLSPLISSSVTFHPCGVCGKSFMRLHDSGLCDDCEKMRRGAIQPGQIDTTAELRRAGVGKRYAGAALDNFVGGAAYVRYCAGWSKKPEPCYLYGPYGCGKTHLAVSMCRSAIDAGIKKIMFRNASDIFMEIRGCYGGKGDEAATVKKFCDTEILFIDDLGADKASEWSRATMYLIIDRRDRELLPTVITSNLSPAQIGEAIDGRISSRLANGKIIEIKMPDYRLKR